MIDKKNSLLVLISDEQKTSNEKERQLYRLERRIRLRTLTRIQFSSLKISKMSKRLWIVFGIRENYIKMESST